MAAAAAPRPGSRVFPAVNASRGRLSSPARALAGLVTMAAVSSAPLSARVFATQEEALSRLMPPPVEIERRTAYLGEAEVRRVEALSGGPLDHQVVPYYAGRRDGQVVAYAFTDTHIVRTLPESVLFGLRPDGRIFSTDILSFDEPPDYQPGARWLEQFKDRGPDPPSLKRDIRTLGGATLSSRAITAAARRVLALFQVVVREGAGRAGDRDRSTSSPAPGRAAGRPEGRP